MAVRNGVFGTTKAKKVSETIVEAIFDFSTFRAPSTGILNVLLWYTFHSTYWLGEAYPRYSDTALVTMCVTVSSLATVGAV
jgi:hypothetical protein